MNKVILIGRLTKDPMISKAPDGTIKVGRFSIAVDRRFKREGDSVTADFFNCVCFGKQAGFVENYLKKGTKMVVSGRLQNSNYKDNNGVMHYNIDVVVEELEFAESKASADSNRGIDVAEPMMDTPPMDEAIDSEQFMKIDPKVNDEFPF